MQSKSAKIALLVATVLPLIFVAYVFWFVFRQLMAPLGTIPFDEGTFHRLLLANLAIMAWSVGLLVAYLLHLFRTSNVPDSQKALWTVALLCASPISMFVYWFRQVWPERRAATVG